MWNGWPGASYPFGGLCGAGVAFKLAWAIATRASGSSRVTPRLREALLRAIGLAAFGTVTDVMPLVDENRLLVKHGLENLRTRGGPGLARLIELTGLADASRIAQVGERARQKRLHIGRIRHAPGHQQAGEHAGHTGRPFQRRDGGPVMRTNVPPLRHRGSLPWRGRS